MEDLKDLNPQDDNVTINKKLDLIIELLTDPAKIYVREWLSRNPDVVDFLNSKNAEATK